MEWDGAYEDAPDGTGVNLSKVAEAQAYQRQTLEETRGAAMDQVESIYLYGPIEKVDPWFEFGSQVFQAGQGIIVQMKSGDR